jgi:hypothetical protein
MPREAEWSDRTYHEAEAVGELPATGSILQQLRRSTDAPATDFTAPVNEPIEDHWLVTSSTDPYSKPLVSSTLTIDQAEAEGQSNVRSVVEEGEEDAEFDPAITTSARQRLELLAKKFVTRLSEEEQARLFILSAKLNALVPIYSPEVRDGLEELRQEHARLDAELAEILKG